MPSYTWKAAQGTGASNTLLTFTYPTAYSTNPFLNDNQVFDHTTGILQSALKNQSCAISAVIDLLSDVSVDKITLSYAALDPIGLTANVRTFTSPDGVITWTQRSTDIATTANFNDVTISSLALTVRYVRVDVYASGDGVDKPTSHLTDFRVYDSGGTEYTPSLDTGGVGNNSDLGTAMSNDFFPSFQV